VANSPQAKKRARQAEKHRLHNVNEKSKFRTYLKKVIAAIQTGNKEAASTAYRAAVSVIDKMVSKKLIHKNKAARHKSRLNVRIKELA
jgi:small subunit ribosomal protein S20